MQENQIMIDKKHITYVSIFLMAFIYIVPIILMNEYYKDDLEVVMHGLAHGIEHARPIQDLLLNILSSSTSIIDIRPLPIILAAILAGFSALILSYRFSPNDFFLGGCCGLLLFMNPFYIEDLFFGLTSFTITFSVLCAVLPFSKKIDLLNPKLRFATSFLLYLFILMNYQPAICLAMVLICADYIFSIRDKVPLSRIANKILINAFSMISAQIVYVVVIAPLMLSGVYSTQRSGIGENIIDNILSNFYQFSLLLGTITHSNFFIFTILPILFIAFITFIVWTSDYFKVHKTKIRTVFLLIAILMPFLLIFISLGPLLILEKTVIRARVLIGFGGILFICFLIFIQLFKDYFFIKRMIFIPILYLFIFMVNVANIQKETMKNQYAITGYIYHDIIRNVKLADVEAVLTLGSHNNLSLMYTNAAAVNPLIAYLVSTTLYGQWEAVGLYQSLLRFGLKKPYIPKNHPLVKKINDEFCESYSPVVQSTEYNIYLIDHVLLVDLSWCLPKRADGKTTPQGVYW